MLAFGGLWTIFGFFMAGPTKMTPCGNQRHMPLSDREVRSADREETGHN